MNNIELHIDELQKEGWGVASWLRPDGLLRVVTVPNSLPGEQVVCDLFRSSCKKTSGLVGDVKEITRASPLRIKPLCKHFPICGGCTWQHMPYQEQLKLKSAAVETLFFDLITPDTALHPIIGSPSSWRYRNKMEFSFSEDTKGQKFLGLIMRCSKGRVFTVEECHLVNPWMADLLQAVYKWWGSTKLSAYYLPKK